MKNFNFIDWLQYQNQISLTNNVNRNLIPRAKNNNTINLATNDYLGLSTNKYVKHKSIRAINKWGTGSTGSRLVTGNTTLHHTLESELTKFLGTEASLVYSSGYLANLATIAAITNENWIIISDINNHASLIDGCKLSKAKKIVADLSNLNVLYEILKNNQEKIPLVICESIISTTGISYPINKIYDICNRFNAILLVDEAHALGIVGAGGRGMVNKLKLQRQKNVIISGTLSKTFGSQGGFISGTKSLKSFLINNSRGFIFDTGLNPAAVAAAISALKYLKKNPQLPKELIKKTKLFIKLLNQYKITINSQGGAIVTIFVGDEKKCYDIWKNCKHMGLQIACFRSPTVTKNQALLRISINNKVSVEEIKTAAKILNHNFKK